jgi:4-carboxymuconolactone decarboxylase
LEYKERLRRLALNDPLFARGDDVAGVAGPNLDPKTLALIRLAALIAVGGAVPSYGPLVEDAVEAGASSSEIVDVLVGVIPVVGLPSVVAEAPKLARALGYDIEEALERFIV